MTKKLLLFAFAAFLLFAPAAFAAVNGETTSPSPQDYFGPEMMARFGGFGPGWMMSSFGLSWGWFIFWHFVFGLGFIALATWVVKAVWQSGKKK